eukprot:266080-Amphidinium_carterae.1
MVDLGIERRSPPCAHEMYANDTEMAPGRCAERLPPSAMRLLPPLASTDNVESARIAKACVWRLQEDCPVHSRTPS